jgi:putative ABC transport system permease protein
LLTFYRDAPDMQGITTVLALSAVVAGFMTIMVVAGTFAFSIALRRRLMAQLRLLGASGGQVRRMVVAEAVLVAIPAAAVGCLIAALLTPPTVRAVDRSGLSPVRLPGAPHPGPLLCSFGVGLLLAATAALLASHRASRVPPIEALTDAALDTHVMTGGRWGAGLLALGAGTLMMSLAPAVNALNATPLAIFGTSALTVAAVFLGPACLPWISRIGGLASRRSTAMSVHIALAAAAASRRRTASLVAPILAITAIVGIVLGVMRTSDATAVADQLARIRGQLIATPAHGTGFDDATLRRLANAPGVTSVYAPAPVRVAIVTEGGSGPGQKNGAKIVTGVSADPIRLSTAERVTAVEGRIAPLTGDEVAVNQDYSGWYGLHVGSRLRLGFFDGRTAEVSVAVVLRGAAQLPGIMMPPGLAGDQAGPPPMAVLTLGEASSTAAERVAASARARVVPVADWNDAAGTAQARLRRAATVILAGPASLFALVAVGNILVMSYRRRGREFETLRLLGGSTGLVRRIVVAEAVVVTTIGVGVAALFITAGLGGLHAAQARDYAATSVQVPWLVLSVLVAGCLTVAVVTGLVIVGRLLRRTVPS